MAKLSRVQDRIRYKIGVLQRMDRFLAFETERRKCPRCGSILCVHRTFCLECGFSDLVLFKPHSSGKTT